MEATVAAEFFLQLQVLIFLMQVAAAVAAMIYLTLTKVEAAVAESAAAVTAKEAL
jgi:hypothetical protein